MKTYKIIYLLIILIPLNSLSQFKANMTNVVTGNERNYKVFSDLLQYKYEFEEDGMKGIVLVNPSANQTFVVLPDKKFVHKTTCDGMMSRINDPVQSYMWYKKHGEEKHAGNENINGYNCQINELYQGDSKIFTMWFSEKLNFPVKITGHFSKNTYMELKDITSWKPDASWFTVPDDYTEVDEQMRPVIPKPPPPDKWETKEASVPFKESVPRGIKLKIKVSNSVYHKMVISNEKDNPAKIIRHLLRNGQELSDDEQGPLEYRTKRLHSGEKKTYTFDWKAGDEVILEVYEGEMNINIYPE